MEAVPIDDAASLRPTPRYRDVLRLAEDQARQHGHHHLGVEHLMLGILDGGRSVATGVLAKFLDLQELREAIEQILTSVGYGRPPQNRSLEGVRSENTPVTLVRGDERQQALIHWTLQTPNESGERFRMQLEWSGDPIQVDAGDLFDTLVRVRRQLELEGWFVAVQGSRLDVYPSAIQREMTSGLNAYVLRTGEPTRPQDIVETLGPADPGTLATVAAQREHATEWERTVYRSGPSEPVAGWA
jgi:Clp amino terminal domain, pathogenicity island component